ncbi:hypothetical protein [Brevibacillus choshinensis]|uniref:hypothetical protein n=1 Tax=Brevibacillus choshinensis TaxID=54911 RepID=UPI002E1D01FB|nr:hypothetical protein [Brevibacillus choshinensis]
MVLSVDKFLHEIFGNEKINFRCISRRGDRPIDYNGFYNQYAINVLTQANEQNYEIYFVVNSGGYKDQQILRINAVFIDLDCGKDSQGKYYDLELVNAYKQKKLIELQSFKCKPTFVNETRNGLQVFWLLHPGATTEQFLFCEDRLIAFFDADSKVKNLARLMRVPDYYWCKDIDHKFLSKVIERNETRYRISEIIESLPDIKKEDKCDYDKEKSQTLLSIVGTPIPHKSQIQPIRIITRNIENIQLKQEEVLFQNHDEVYDYLKKQDLGELLGTKGQYFNCIFHNDKSPSAVIIVNETTGHHIYHCFSSKCGFTGTILDCVKKIYEIDTITASRFLRKVYKVGYAKNEWQENQLKILVENQRILGEDIRSKYSILYKFTSKYHLELFSMIEFAKRFVSTETYATQDGRPVFFISIRHLARIIKKDPKRVVERINLLTYLGLLRKICEDEIPGHLLQKAKEEAIRKKQKNLISFYSVPSYTESLLVFAESKAKEYTEKGFTIRGWSREMLYRVLGAEEADRVYPQLKDRQLPKSSDDITSELEKVALGIIDQKGWVTEKEIINQMKLTSFRHEKVAEKQLKIVISEFLDKYNLAKRKLNKQLKEKLKISEKGYFNVIYSISSQAD